jgi:hypothetical protein
VEVLTRILVLSLVLLTAAGTAPAALAAAASGQALTEAQAKAGFLYNCAMFVAWPTTAFKKEELVIGVIGDDAVSGVVKDMQGQKVNGRTLRVSAVRSLDELDDYHILFVAGDDDKTAKSVLAKIGAAPVLTVGEQDDFTADGGVVRLYTDQGRLRFEINMTRAEGAGLRVSAKMLGLAKIVR